MMEPPLGKEEFQAAAGHLKAELHRIKDEFQHAQITAEAYRNQAKVIVRATQRFKREYYGTVLAVSLESRGCCTS